MKIIQVKQRGPEWHAWRKKGITATDSAVILGKSPYKTPWRLWAEKTGRVQPEDLSKNPNVQRGNRLEDHARQKFEEKHDVILLPVCGESDEDGIFIASLDGVTASPEPVELKCPTDKTFEDVRDNREEAEAVKLYYIQVQHQIYVTGAQGGYLVFYRKQGRAPAEMIELRIERDERLIAEIIEQGAKFHDLILTEQEPAKDPERDFFVPSEAQQEQWADLARHRYRMDRELAQLEARAKDIKKALKENEAGLLGLMDKAGFTHADHGGVKITRYQTMGSVDYPKLLKDQLPDLGQEEIDRYRKKPSSRVRIAVSSEADTKAAFAPFLQVVDVPGDDDAADEKRMAFAW